MNQHPVRPKTRNPIIHPVHPVHAGPSPAPFLSIVYLHQPSARYPADPAPILLTHVFTTT